MSKLPLVILAIALMSVVTVIVSTTPQKRVHPTPPSSMPAIPVMKMEKKETTAERIQRLIKEELARERERENHPTKIFKPITRQEVWQGEISWWTPIGYGVQRIRLYDDGSVVHEPSRVDWTRPYRK